MTRGDIQLHLIERYVNGYSVMDYKYEEIKKSILNEINYHCSLDNLQNIMQKYIGKYTEFTGELYSDILCFYIKRIMHKSPTQELVSTLIRNLKYNKT